MALPHWFFSATVDNQKRWLRCFWLWNLSFHTRSFKTWRKKYSDVQRKCSVNKGSLCWGSFGDLKKSAGVTPGLLLTRSITSFLSIYLYCFSIKSWIQAAGGCGGKTEFGCAFCWRLFRLFEKSCEMLLFVIWLSYKIPFYIFVQTFIWRWLLAQFRVFAIKRT